MIYVVKKKRNRIKNKDDCKKRILEYIEDVVEDLR